MIQSSRHIWNTGSTFGAKNIMVDKPWPLFMVFACSLWGRLDGHTIRAFNITWCKLKKREALKRGGLILDWRSKEGLLEYMVFELILRAKNELSL